MAAPPLGLYLTGRSFAGPYEARPRPTQDCFDVSFQSRSGEDELVLSCASDEFFQPFRAPLDRFERNPAPPASRLGRKVFPSRGAYWISEGAPAGKPRGLWLTDLAGGGRYLVGEHGAEAAVSANGEKIAYVARAPGQAARLFVTDRRVSGKAALDTGEGELAFPAFAGEELFWYQRPDAKDPWRLTHGTLSFAGRSGEFARILEVRGERVLFESVAGAPLPVPGEAGRFVQAGKFRGHEGLYLIDFATRLDGACVRRLRDGAGLSRVAFSRDGKYLAWIEQRQILVAPFSATNAPCDGSRTGVEWKR